MGPAVNEATGIFEVNRYFKIRIRALEDRLWRNVFLCYLLNFHKTFIPERRLIADILIMQLRVQGNYQEISSDTGIPMGKSSGKVWQ